MSDDEFIFLFQIFALIGALGIIGAILFPEEW